MTTQAVEVHCHEFDGRPHGARLIDPVRARGWSKARDEEIPPSRFGCRAVAERHEDRPDRSIGKSAARRAHA
jgi:hypothetical protein